MNKLPQGYCVCKSRDGTIWHEYCFGFGGLIDVASPHGLKEPKAGDFGATLAIYGIGDGPYLVLPLLGPSNPRDSFGSLVDEEASPWGYVFYTTYPEQIGVDISEGAVRAADSVDNYENAQRASLDLCIPTKLLAPATSI